MKIKDILNHKYFVLGVRSLSWIYFAAFLINILFFYEQYEQYLYKIWHRIGLLGIFAVWGTSYKSKNTVLWKRILEVICLLLLEAIVVYKWYTHYH